MKPDSMISASLRITFAWLVMTNMAIAQPLLLQNPSFEDFPGLGKPPFGWFFCGNMGETPPDIHPGDLYGVTAAAKDGHTYVGMVSRHNGTYEQLGQRLSQPLVPGQCYYFRIFAARSDQYASFSRKTGQPSQYTLPLKLAVLAAHRHCQPMATLALSAAVMDTEWRSYGFVLRPDEAFSFLFLSATSATGDSYNGNILIDAASPLIPCSCEETAPKLSRMPVPTPEQAGLKNWLAEQQQHIRFDAAGCWPRELFENEAGVIYYTNPHFWNVVQVLKKLSGAKLMVEYHPDRLSEKCRLEMLAILDAAGLPKKRYAFKSRTTLEGVCHIIVNGSVKE